MVQDPNDACCKTPSCPHLQPTPAPNNTPNPNPLNTMVPPSGTTLVPNPNNPSPSGPTAAPGLNTTPVPHPNTPGPTYIPVPQGKMYKSALCCLT